MNITQRRLAEVAKYEAAHRHPKYNMKEWRRQILFDWLSESRGTTYLDVGCGKAETLDIATEACGWEARGCDVVDYLCERGDVDLIEGAHKLPYDTDQFHITSCNDVLEHVIEDDVPAVLSELSRVTRRDVLLGISRKKGPLHITIKSEEWWLEKIAENMAGTHQVVFADRVPKIKQPYLWVEIQCA